MRRRSPDDKGIGIIFSFLALIFQLVYLELVLSLSKFVQTIGIKADKDK